ncbi:MAG: O-antigen ligase family protein [Beijerinckiaceae bacterium]|nr:O-antigen ligase family protein [Beijerinckiaceae bacterium]
MPLNFSQMTAADKVSLVTVTLLPIASLAGNAAADIALVVNVVLFLALSGGNFKSFFQSSFLRLAFAFWGWILICSAVSAFPSHSFQDSLPWIRFPLYAFALSHLLGKNSGRNLNYFIGAAIFGTLIELAFMLHEYIFIRRVDARLFGTFGKLIAGWYLTCFSLIAIFWCLEKLRHARISLQISIIIYLFVATVSYGVIITGEIMSTLFFFGSLILYLVIRNSYSLKSFGVVVIGLFVLIIGGIIVSVRDPLLYERLIHSITTRLPWMPSSDYNLPWSTGVTMAIQNPLIGVGPKNFNLYCSSLQTEGTLEELLRVTQCQWHPHNLYLQIADETGIFGLLGFTSIAAYLIYAAYRHSKSNLWVSNVPIILMSVIFFPIQTYSQAFGQAKNFYLWSLIGFASYLIRQQLKERGSDERL